MMFNLSSKFIVIENTSTKKKAIYLGRCYFHKELLGYVNDRNNDKWKCIGGGNFTYSNNTFQLDGKSHDYGIYPYEILIDCIKNNMVFDKPNLQKPIKQDEYTYKILNYTIYPQDYTEIKITK